MKDHKEMPSAMQTDLAFKRDWHFHLTKNVDFTPQDGDKYSCKVTHGLVSKDYAWGEILSAKMFSTAQKIRLKTQKNTKATL